MPRLCTVCTHPQLRAINSELVKGLPVTGIARRFEVGRDAITRHGRTCIKNNIRVAKYKRNVRSAQTLQEQLDQLRDYVEAIMFSTKDEDIMLKAVGQRHKQIELTAKLTGEFKTEIVQMTDEYRRQRIAEIFDSARDKLLARTLPPASDTIDEITEQNPAVTEQGQSNVLYFEPSTESDEFNSDGFNSDSDRPARGISYQDEDGIEE